MRFHSTRVLALLLACAALGGCEGSSDDGVRFKPGSPTSALTLPL